MNSSTFLKIRHVWELIFPDQEILEDSDFFQLGGESIQAIDMVLEVEKVTGKRIPIGVLYTASTLSGLATAIEAIDGDDKTPILTPLNDKGTGHPLFLIAPAIGGVFHYKDFWQHIGEPHRAYCLEPQISTFGDHSYASVEEVASCLIDLMKTVQPDGPYRLCGYSFGGSLAWEMARQLDKQGMKIECLLALDSIVRGYESFLPAERDGAIFWIRKFVTAWKDHRAHGQWLSLSHISGLVWKKLRSKLAPGPSSAKPDDIAEAEGLNAIENRVQEDLRAKYDYGTYNGELIFLRARSQLTLHRELSYDLGWKGRPLAGLRIIPVPGHHLNLMRPPVSIEVAAKVADVLNELDKNHDRQQQQSNSTAPRAKIVYPVDSVGTVLQQFYQVVERLGDKEAVFDEGVTVTYNDLNHQANVIANALPAFKPEDKGVYVFLPTTRWMIAAFLGVFKAGRFYIPVDPDHPDSRIKLIIGDSESTTIVTSRHLEGRLRTIFGKKPFHPVFIEDLDYSGTLTTCQNPTSPEDMAAVLYTSGSTGRPKGVVHTQKSISYVAWRRGKGIDLDSRDRYLMVYSGAFMGALNAIYGAMLYGACLYIYNLRKSGIANLGPWLNSHRVTVFHAVTSIYRQFVGQLEETDRFPHIRCVTPGGEPSRMSDIKQFKEHFERGTVYYANLGSSECGSIAFDPIYHETTVHPDLPVGIPFESLAVFILDQDANPLPCGEIGEIALCSNSIFKEYWRNPEKTAAVLKPFDQEKKLFLTGDFGYVLPDGRLVNKGREDGQVKVNGYRVEIPEVESALLSIETVRETAVVTRPDESENLRLVAFIRMDQTEDGFPVSEIRGRLMELLPRPMVPTQYHAVSKFPLKDNGKLDRKLMSSAPLDSFDFLIQ